MECLCIALKAFPAPHDFDAPVQLTYCFDAHVEAEAIQELRADFTLFGIPGTDQHEAGGMAQADAFALDDVPPARRDIQEQIHEMVFQEIDFINVEETTVRAGK